MSIGAQPIGEAAVSGQLAPATSTTKPPKPRQTTAQADATAQPEAR